MNQISFEEAIKFAEEAHRGQVYSHPDGDQPYIEHPLRVSRNVSEKSKIAAILHDCLEDAGRLPENLDVTSREAIDLLTRRKESESYEEFIQRITEAGGEAGEIAREVKVADIKDNLSNIRPGHKEYLRARYEAALKTLRDF